MRNFILTLIVLTAILICGCQIAQPRQGVIPQTQKELLFQSVQKTNWLVTVSIIGIGLSIFSFINGGKDAMAAAVACFVVLTMSLAVARFATVMAVVGTIISLGLSGYTIFIKNRAIKEIVKNVQGFKDTWNRNDGVGAEIGNDAVSRERIRMVNRLKGALSTQSKTTKDIVTAVKKELAGNK